MKKVICLVFTTMLMFAMTACGNGGEYKVDNEKDAVAVYTCPADNMFGLEKIVIFEDKVVTVFDKAINDESECGRCKYNVEDTTIYGSYAHFSNLSKSKTVDARIEEKHGKYIGTVKFEYDDADKVDPDKNVEVSGVDVCEQDIKFNDQGILLTYIMWGGECSEDFDQNYDFSTMRWGETHQKTSYYPMTVVE